jgi:hypothetical protein
MHVGLTPVLVLHVLVRDMDMLHRGVVVIMAMGRQQMTPVLSHMEVMGHVVVLVAVFDVLVLVVTLRLRHLCSPPPRRFPFPHVRRYTEAKSTAQPTGFFVVERSGPLLELLNNLAKQSDRSSPRAVR